MPEARRTGRSERGQGGPRPGSVWRRATASSRLSGSRSWTRMGACALLVCAPLAVALLTEGRGTDPITRIAVLLAFGLALAVGAVLLLRASDARAALEAAAPERALRQARDQQAATAEILGAMAASPPDLQRVLDTIARNAARVCDGLYAVVFRSDGTEIRLAAHHGLSPSRLAALNRAVPHRRERRGVCWPARFALASVFHFPDLLERPGHPDVAPRPRARRGVPQPGRRADGAGRSCRRKPQRLPPGGRLHRASDPAPPDVRRPGGDRDRERAPLPGAAGAEP